MTDPAELWVVVLLKTDDGFPLDEEEGESRVEWVFGPFEGRGQVESWLAAHAIEESEDCVAFPLSPVRFP